MAVCRPFMTPLLRFRRFRVWGPKWLQKWGKTCHHWPWASLWPNSTTSSHAARSGPRWSDAAARIWSAEELCLWCPTHTVVVPPQQSQHTALPRQPMTQHLPQAWLGSCGGPSGPLVRWMGSLSLGFWLASAFSPLRANMATAESLQKEAGRAHRRLEISRMHLSYAHLWASPGAPYLIWSRGPPTRH